MYIPKGICLKLLKFLYGLRTSPNSWDKTIDKKLRELHFKPTVSDSCFLHSKWVIGKLHLILVHMDDILIASKDEDYILEIKKGTCAEYNMTDMGELDNFLNSQEEI
jgi:hypothetical protein